MIEKNGWYKASNHGENLSGVSRDHIVSVKYGFKNRILPEIISHPANCQLLVHNDNQAKHDKCLISLEELKIRIQKWNDKYGPID